MNMGSPNLKYLNIWAQTAILGFSKKYIYDTSSGGIIMQQRFKLVLGILILILHSSDNLLGQESNENNFTFAQLNDSIKKHYFDTPSIAKQYSRLFLTKAKDDSLPIKIARGYHLLSGFYYREPEVSLQLLDSSLLTYNELGRHYYYPAVVYMNKGSLLEKEGRLIEATNNHLLSAEYAAASNTSNLLHYAKFNLAGLKRRVKKYVEAERLLEETIAFEKSKSQMTRSDSLSLLLSISDFIDIIRLKNDYSTARQLNNQALADFANFNEKYLFELNAVNIAVDDNSYEEALELLEGDSLSLDLLNGTKEFDNEFYKVSLINSKIKGLYGISKNSDYVSELYVADSLYRELRYVDYRFKDIYKQLIQIARDSALKKQELAYIEKYLEIDSVIERNFHPIDEKINEEFDRKFLIAEKDNIITQLNEQTKTQKAKIIIAIICVAVLLVLTVYFATRRQRLKKRFKTLQEDIESGKIGRKPNLLTSTYKAEKGLSDTIKSELSLKLQEFEESEGFLDRKMTLNSLAKELGTNSKYLSKFVNSELNTSFNNYLNSLRINYFIERSQNDDIFQKFTITAVAKECGYNSAEVFSKAFSKITNISPAYYLNQLDKQNDS
ncbi:helix-turn-helix domain-containing protein [Croceiramulus getboli]|nr:AraC family transcriptional regulator [Flavobacteriaceae bacterium YJPT1-3]